MDCFLNLKIQNNQKNGIKNISVLMQTIGVTLFGGKIQKEMMMLHNEAHLQEIQNIFCLQKKTLCLIIELKI